MMDDDLEIPAFLRRRPEDEAKVQAAWDARFEAKRRQQEEEEKVMASRVATMLEELNGYRVALGSKPLKSWKASTRELEEDLASAKQHAAELDAKKKVDDVPPPFKANDEAVAVSQVGRLAERVDEAKRRKESGEKKPRAAKRKGRDDWFPTVYLGEDGKPVIASFATIATMRRGTDRAVVFEMMAANVDDNKYAEEDIQKALKGKSKVRAHGFCNRRDTGVGCEVRRVDDVVYPFLDWPEVGKHKGVTEPLKVEQFLRD